MEDVDQDILDKNENTTKITKWLIFAKAIREALPVITALIIVYFAFYTYISSNLTNLNKENRELEEIIDSKSDSIKVLTSVVDSYNSKRFVIHRLETRVLFSDVYLYFSGTHRDDWAISTIDSTILSSVNLPRSKPQKFTAYGKEYFILAERIFKGHSGGGSDSAIIYIDTLRNK